MFVGVAYLASLVSPLVVVDTIYALSAQMAQPLCGHGIKHVKQTYLCSLICSA